MARREFAIVVRECIRDPFVPVVHVTLNVRLLAMKSNKISQKRGFKNEHILVLRRSISSLWTHKTNCRARNKSHNFGFVSMYRCN